MKLSKALGNNTVLEKSNERLAEENDSLKQENMALKEFKEKVIKFFKRFIDKTPVIKSFIDNEVSEIKDKIIKIRYIEGGVE